MADIEAIKKSIIVLVDQREQKNMHLLNGLQQKGVNWKPCTLKYCDYSFMVPKNEQLGVYEDFEFFDKVALERKNSLTEIAGNFCKGRIRFETEFAKANAEGCKVTLLIEDEKAKEKMRLRRELDRLQGFSLEKKYAKTWRGDFKGESMIGSIKAFKDRYNLELVFCNKKKTADVMLETFYKAIEEYFSEVS